MLRVCTKTLPLSLIPEIGASLGRIFQDSDWLRDGPMRRIGPPWGIFGQESLQIPPAERSPGSTLGLGPLLDIQTFGGRRRRQFEPRYARVEPPPAPTASGPISNIGPRPRADPRRYNLWFSYYGRILQSSTLPFLCWLRPQRQLRSSFEDAIRIPNDTRYRPVREQQQYRPLYMQLMRI